MLAIIKHDVRQIWTSRNLDPAPAATNSALALPVLWLTDLPPSNCRHSCSLDFKTSAEQRFKHVWRQLDLFFTRFWLFLFIHLCLYIFWWCSFACASHLFGFLYVSFRSIATFRSPGRADAAAAFSKPWSPGASFFQHCFWSYTSIFNIKTPCQEDMLPDKDFPSAEEVFPLRIWDSTVVAVVVDVVQKAKSQNYSNQLIASSENPWDDQLNHVSMFQWTATGGKIGRKL